MSSLIGTLIDVLVAGLLAVTIGYCVLLNRRLTRLKADEANLRATISELITATEIAERAIHGLRTIAAETDRTLGKRLRDAEKFSHDIERQLLDGEQVFARIAQITQASKPATITPRTGEPGEPSEAAPASEALRRRASEAAQRLQQIRRGRPGEAA
jgi:hypothetical protein